MRLPPSPQQDHGTFYAQGAANEDDEEFELGWECANPSLQIDCWKEETAAESCEAPY